VASIRLFLKGETLKFRWKDSGWKRFSLFHSAPVVFEKEGQQFHGRVLSKSSSAEGELWHYRVETDTDEYELAESEFSPLRPEGERPYDQLVANAWRSPRRFAVRWLAMLTEAGWYEDTDGIPAFLGSRVRFMGHQLYAARRVLWDRCPRFILADEVGLGKTIEAGLVVQSLSAADPGLRVLVIAPGAMTRQWLCELYLRFGARAYAHVNASRVREESHSKLLEVLKSDRLIVSTTALEKFPSIGTILTSQKWGLVIVDEAHHYAQDSNLYKVLASLSANSYGFLVLSATPSKRELRSLHGLLALVAPEVYAADQVDEFEKRFARQEKIWDKLEWSKNYIQRAIEEQGVLEQEDLDFVVEEWEGILDSDPTVVRFLSDLRAGRSEAADQLVAYVQEFHRIDHRLIRTRRATVDPQRHHWGQRQFEIIDYEFSAEEAVLAQHYDRLSQLSIQPESKALKLTYARLLSASPEYLIERLKDRKSPLRQSSSSQSDLFARLVSDPGPADDQQLTDEILEKAASFDGEREWLNSAAALAEEWHRSDVPCTRYKAARDWILRHLAQDSKNKVLVFAQVGEIVEEFADVMIQALERRGVAIFLEGLPEGDLADEALRFQRESTCRVLVSDELGGEGRNFQMATAVLHLDTPWSVAKLEQRIGRLDRAGRDPSLPIISVVMQGPGQAERALIRLHSEVFQVYSRSIGGMEFKIPEFQRTILEALTSGPDALLDLLPSFSKAVEEELAEASDAFRKAIDASRVQLERANQLAELLCENRREGTDFAPLAKWAHLMQIQSRQEEDGAFEYSWNWEHLPRPPVGLSVDGRMPTTGKHSCVGTYSREVALQNESLQFFGPGHRLIDAILMDVKGCPEGRSSVVARNLGEENRGKLFLLVLGQCKLLEAGLPAGLLARARRFLWPEVISELFEMNTNPPSLQRVEDGLLRSQLLDPQMYLGARKIDPEKFSNAISAAAVWAVVNEALPMIESALSRLRVERKAQGCSALADDLRQEMEYYHWVVSQGEPRQSQQAQRELELRQRLLERASGEFVHIEGLAVIVGTNKN